MSKTRSYGIFLIASVIVVTVFVYYRYTQDMLSPTRENEVSIRSGMPVGEQPEMKSVSAVVTYDAYEGKMDTLRFVVSLDQAGGIQGIKTLDAVTNEIPEKKKEFNDRVNVILKGKKLSELTAIDKVGESSRTTEAFNKVLPELQAAL